MAPSNEVCPDPSAHEHSHASRLQDQASKAALYVTHQDKQAGDDKSGREIDALGPDGKLSAAGAAASLKYAQPHDLPSFPSVGIDTASSGNKAANLANANQKPFEHWKPELSASASKAALLANKKGDFAEGLWQPSASANGMSAAGIAMKGAHSVDLDYGYTEEGRRRALLAATLSVSKKRDAPAPAPEPAKYPDAQNSAANALNAATVAHKPQMTDVLQGRMSDEANEMSRITHLQNVPREMFSEHPPLNIESEEQKRQVALKAATLSNQAKVEETRRQLIEQQAAQAAMHNNVREQAKNYLTLQSEAQKLANERLAKLDPDGAAAFREHYGYGDNQQTSPKHKLSIRGRRGNSDANKDDDDENDDARRAGRIRHQTRNLHAQVQSIDDKKKQDDRAALQAAAERLVKARLSKMDDQVFQDTGKASPAMMGEWERQARAKANANVEERMKHYGKVHIGGGKYMDQSEIDAIAAGRMQPTLDEITDTAEKQRARDEEIRLDQERRRHETQVEQAREKEKKDAVKRQKDEEKAAEKAEKDAEKARQKEEKELAAIHKRLNKEEEKQLKEQRKEQDKAWVAEQQRADEEREEKAKEKRKSQEAEAAAAAATAERPSTPPAAAATTAADETEHTSPVIKDMRTGEPKDISTTQKQAPIAALFGSSRLFHGHDGPHPDKSGHVVDDEGKGTTEEQRVAGVASPATHAAHAEDSTQDPPGVPKVFPGGEQPADLVTTGRVPADSTGVAADTHFRSSKTEKRKSGLKGMLGKFKRTSRHSEGEAGEAASTEPKGKARAPVVGGAARDASPSPSLSSSLPDSDDEREPSGEVQSAVVSDNSNKNRRSLLGGVFGSKKGKTSESTAAATPESPRQSRSRTTARDGTAEGELSALPQPVPAAAGATTAGGSGSIKSHSPVPGSRFAEEL